MALSYDTLMYKTCIIRNFDSQSPLCKTRENRLSYAKNSKFSQFINECIYHHTDQSWPDLIQITKLGYLKNKKNWIGFDKVIFNEQRDETWHLLILFVNFALLEGIHRLWVVVNCPPINCRTAPPLVPIPAFKTRLGGHTVQQRQARCSSEYQPTQNRSWGCHSTLLFYKF